MSFIFKIDRPLTGTVSSGENYPRAFHAYKARIADVVSDKGYIKLKLEGIDYKAGQYDAISQKADSQYISDWIFKTGNAIAASNPSYAAAVGQTQLDLTKWKGKEIGVVYKPQQRKDDNGAYVDTKYSEPHYAIAISQVDDWKVDQAKYDAWQNSVKGGGNPSYQANSGNSLPVEDDGSTLPF